VAFSADNEVLWARRSYASGAQYYFAKSSAALPSGFDQAHKEFFTEYFNDLKNAAQIPRTDEFVTELDNLRKRLSRSGRFEALDSVQNNERTVRKLLGGEPGKPLSELITDVVTSEFEFATSLEWIARDPHSTAAWTYVVGDAELRPYERIVRFGALLETFMRIIIAFCDSEADVNQLENMSFAQLTTEIAKGLKYHRINTDEMLDTLEQIRIYRNTLLHDSGYGAQSPKKHADLLMKVVRVSQAFIDEVLLQGAEQANDEFAVDRGCDSGRIFTVAEDLMSRLGPETKQREIELELSEQKDRLWTALANALREVNEHQSELERKRIDIQDQYNKCRNELAAGRAAFDAIETLLARQATMAHHVISATQGQLEQTDQRIHEIEKAMNQLSLRLASVETDISATKSQQATALEDYRAKNVNAQQTATTLYARKELWRKVRDWLNERHLNEVLARITRKPLVASGWDERSREIDWLVDAVTKNAMEDSSAVIEQLCEKIQQWVGTA
jgi:hypothetical protein